MVLVKREGISGISIKSREVSRGEGVSGISKKRGVSGVSQKRRAG